MKTARFKASLLGVTLGGITTAMAAGAALAQQAPLASSGGDDQLQEVVVTATRQARSIQEVPNSIDALTQSELSDAGIKNIAELAGATPGLQFSTPVAPSTITTVNIRGINTNSGPATVGIYLDDTPLGGRLSPLGNIGGPLPLINDLNRVEVERGPQGTLFGSGTEAGAVRFITNDPSLSGYSGDVEGEWSSTKSGEPSYEYGFAAGGPIQDDTLGFRISAWDRRDGGYVNLVSPLPGPGPDNAVVDPNANRNYEQAFRLALTYKLGGVRITPSIYYQSVDKDDSGRFYPAYSDDPAQDYNDAAFLPEHSIDRWVLPTLKIESPLPFADLTFVSSYLHRAITVTNDFGDCYVCFGTGPVPYPGLGVSGYGSPLGADVPVSAADAAPTVTGQRNEAYTQELRLASNQPDAFITWVGGLFYDVRKQQDYQLSTLEAVEPSGLPVFTVQQNYRDSQIAAFAQGDFHLSKQWIVTLGYRVARIDTDFNAIEGGTAFGVPPGSPTLLAASTSNTPTTPKAVLSYQLDRNNLFYLSASKGFRAGGGNANLPNGCAGAGYHEGYDPDWVWSYELGAKQRMLDGRLEIDSSIYHVNWSNIQSLVAASPCGITYVENTGEAAVNGFDTSIQALITRQLRLDAKVSFTNAYYTETTYNGTSIAVEAGDKIGFLPQVIAPWNVDVAAQYTMPLATGNSIHLRIEDQYNSHNPGPFQNGIVGGANYVPLDQADPATNLVNARLGYTLGKLEASIFADNVFDQQPLIGKLSYFSVSSPYRVQYSTFRPRTIGVAANYAF